MARREVTDEQHDAHLHAVLAEALGDKEAAESALAILHVFDSISDEASPLYWRCISTSKGTNEEYPWLMLADRLLEASGHARLIAKRKGLLAVPRLAE
jgi:hypothetical protein